MTRNQEEPTIRTADFGGINRDVDPHDVPFGMWTRLKNTITDVRKRTMRTRDGLIAVSDRLFNDPFAILGGAAGGRTLTIPEFPPPPAFGDYALKLVASPNKNLNAGDTVTFVVYPSGLDSGVTISTYNWDFTYDGESRNTDSSGAATSQNNQYNSAGTYTCYVWGTGSDTVEYGAKCTIVVRAAGEVGPEPSDPPDPPPELPDEDDDETDVLTPFITLSPETQTVETSTVAELTYNAQNADNVYFYGLDGTEVEQSNLISGLLTVTPSAAGTYTVSVLATNANGTANAAAQITATDTPDALLSGWLQIDDQVVESGVQTDIIVYSREDGTENAAPFPSGSDQIAMVIDTPNATTDNLSTISPSLNVAETESTFEDAVFTLSGVNVIDTITVKAYVPDRDDITPAIGTFIIYDPTADVEVVIEDETGTDLTRCESILSGEFCYCTFYLKLTVKDPVLTTTITDYNKDVLVSWVAGDGYPDNPLVSITTASPTNPYSSSDTIAITETIVTDTTYKVIPAEIWQLGSQNGICTVKVTVQFDATQDYTTAKWQDMTFSARERTASE